MKWMAELPRNYLYLLISFSWEKPGIYSFHCASRICQYTTDWLLWFVFIKTWAEWWRCTQKQWGAFCPVIVKHQIFPFNSCLHCMFTQAYAQYHNPFTAHTVFNSKHTVVPSVLVGCIKLGSNFRLLIKDNGMNMFHANSSLMDFSFSSSPGSCPVHWVSLLC